MESIKCVIVGDKSTGKTSLLHSYLTNESPSEYMSKTLGCEIIQKEFDGIPCSIMLSTTTGNEDYDTLRPLIYENADVFLVCFSVVSPSSFENVKKVWVPEISSCCPNKPFLLVGTKADLRDDSSTIQKLAKEKLQPLSRTQGENLAKEVNAIRYLECSAFNQKKVQNIFRKGILNVLRNKYPENHNNCVLS